MKQSLTNYIVALQRPADGAVDRSDSAEVSHAVDLTLTATKRRRRFPDTEEELFEERSRSADE